MRKSRPLLLSLMMSLLLSCLVAGASPPLNYTLTYVHKDKAQKVTMIQRFYVLAGNKMRIETGNDNDGYMVNIYRKDKNVTWTVFPDEKQYMEQGYDQDLWDLAQTGAADLARGSSKKAGEIKFLGYNCDVYESVNGNNKSITLIAQGTNIVLKTSSTQNGKPILSMEATEFKLDKPAASLFEIPPGFKKIKL